LKYKPLGLDARRSIWNSFLRKDVINEGGAWYSRKDLVFLAKKDQRCQVGFPTAVRTILIRNDRVLQIKNIVSTAHALATRKGGWVTMSHLEVAITADEDFESDFRGASKVWRYLLLGVAVCRYLATYDIFLHVKSVYSEWNGKRVNRPQ